MHGRSAGTGEVGAQGVVGEHRFPHTWSELSDALCRMLGDALQDIDEVGVEVHALEPAGHEQTLDEADALGTELRPRKQPVAPPGGNRPLCQYDRDTGALWN